MRIDQPVRILIFLRHIIFPASNQSTLLAVSNVAYPGLGAIVRGVALRPDHGMTCQHPKKFLPCPPAAICTTTEADTRSHSLLVLWDHQAACSTWLRPTNAMADQSIQNQFRPDVSEQMRFHGFILRGKQIFMIAARVG